MPANRSLHALRLVSFCLILLLASLTWAATPAEELHSAAGNGDLEQVKALLAAGVDVNTPNRYGATALSFAAQKGHIEVVRLLLAKGATVNVRDTFYLQTPLAWSLGNTEIATLLLAHGADETALALMMGIQRGERALVEAALENGRLYSFERDMTLAMAKQKGDEEIVALISAAEVVPDPQPLTLSAAELASYAGSYREGDDGELLTLAVEEGVLVLRGAGHEKVALQAIEPRHFRGAEDRSLGVMPVGRAGMTERVVILEGASQRYFRRLTELDEELSRSPAAVASASQSSPTAADPAGAQNWPSFRGPNASGIADGQQVVSHWNVESGENIRWQTPIPGLGHASPVVWGDRIFVTTAVSGAGDRSIRTGTYGDVGVVDDASEHTWQIFALDAESGEILWSQQAGKAVPLTDRHLKSTQANSTPATDGQRVVAVFPTVGLFCWDMEGNLQWKQELGALNASWFYDPSVQWGFASSPILYEDLAILQVDVEGGAYIAAFDLASGRQVWKTERDEVPTWATPTLYRGEKRHELITNGTTIRGYDPRTGRELWRLAPNSEVIIATPVVADDLIYVSAGYPPVRAIYAIRGGAEGDISLPEGATSSPAVAWSYDRGGAYMPTPIVYRGIFYIGHHDARLAAYDAATGEPIYRARFSQRGTFTGSPVASDGKLYFPTETGTVYVVKAGPVYEELAINEMGEVLMTTPAIAHGTIYLRTRTHLVAVGPPPA